LFIKQFKRFLFLLDKHKVKTIRIWLELQSYLNNQKTFHLTLLSTNENTNENMFSCKLISALNFVRIMNELNDEMKSKFLLKNLKDTFVLTPEFKQKTLDEFTKCMTNSDKVRHICCVVDFYENDTSKYNNKKKQISDLEIEMKNESQLIENARSTFPFLR